MNLRGDMRVWPVVGFVHASTSYDQYEPFDENKALPSINIDALRKGISKDEVETVFHLPLRALVSPSRLRFSIFRGGEPYWPIDVTDLVTSLGESESSPIEEAEDEIGSGIDGRIEIWGLTGWYLSLLMKALKVQ